MLRLPQFTFGVGDRFGQSAAAQLHAFRLAARAGIDVTPVWNKSNREHLITRSGPADTRAAVERAVGDQNWRGVYFLDADHITKGTVDGYLEHCNYFTIDVADQIGKPVSADRIDTFLRTHEELIGNLVVDGLHEPVRSTRDGVAETSQHYLAAVREAGSIYRHIVERVGTGFVTEISMDETEHPQTPHALLVILAAISDEGIPVQTIAPKFTGVFNKGVDYVGSISAFAREFNEDLCVIAHAIARYGLPENLKLSVHSGSDKFSLYPSINDALRRHRTGVHVKTAGTSWLEELIGLAESGGDGLDVAKRIYVAALAKCEALRVPYTAVIDIDDSQLPGAETVNGWSADDFVQALRHDRSNPAYNPHLRQLLHIGFKIAAGLGDVYIRAVRSHAKTIAQNVTTNLFDRHMKPLFGGL